MNSKDLAKGNKRMLHSKISVSSQVNRMSLEAQLLFTWSIAHADDEGRMKGDPDYVSATVVPMKHWSEEKVKQLLEEIKNQNLICYWEENNSWFIEFPTWKAHQYIQKDRRHASRLPFYNNNNSQLYTTRIQPVYKPETQSNISEANITEFNKSEYKENGNIADKKLKTNGMTSIRDTIQDKIAQIENQQTSTKIYKNLQNEESLSKRTNIHKHTQNTELPMEDPNQYSCKSASEVGAKFAWLKLEPNNPRAFYTTYLSAANKGLSENGFHVFTSEIQQSKSINPGAVFNSKVKSYFEKQALLKNK